ncbi:hypothetical protein HY312_03795 [Candidatus Saccharibacteria bacterium]|nr:hypothetical protein [Candidatus Saccharibacteria bacterium]
MLTANHIQAVRRVLSGEVELSRLRTEYALQESAATAAVLLRAGGVERIARRGEYGRYLATLCITPSVPVEGFPRDADHHVLIPDEESRLWNPDSLVQSSRMLGLHSSTGNGSRIKLTPSSELLLLLEEDGMERAARELFQDAMHRFNESYPYARVELPQVKQNDTAEPVFSMTIVVKRWPEDPVFQEFIAKLGEALRVLDPNQE